MNAVYKRTLRDAFRNLHGWLFIALLMMISGGFIAYHNFMLGTSDICSALCMPIYLPISFGDGYLYVPQMSFWLCLIFPVLTMSSMAADSRDGADELLLSLPVSDAAVVMGKYLALLTVFAVPTALLCLMPLMFSAWGTVDMAASYAALLGFFLQGAVLLALGQLVSSLTRRVWAAYLAGAGVLLWFYLPMTVQWPFLIRHDWFVSFLEWSFTEPLASFVWFTLAGLLLGLAGWRVTRMPVVGAVTAAVCAVVSAILFLAAPDFMSGLFTGLTVTLSPIAQLETMITYSQITAAAVVVFVSWGALALFLTVQARGSRRYR